MEYSDIMERLEEMRPRFNAGFSTSDRILLDSLYGTIYNKPITLTGCSDCYRDAYLLLYNYLKRSGKMPDQTNYRLLRGMVIHEFGSSDYYTLDIPDEIAEDYLLKNKTNIQYFERYPEDWEARITRKNAADAVAALKTTNNTADEQTPATAKKTKRTRK